MKKTLIALLMVLLCAMLIISCSNEPKDEGSSTTPTETPATSSYTVTFDLNGGSGNISAQTVVKDGKATKPATNPTPSNANHYVFEFWAKEGETTEFDFANTAITANTTLVAKWKNKYKVGDTGPGGGTIFYVADTEQTSVWGSDSLTWKYLEAAPSNLNVTYAWGTMGAKNAGTGIGTGWSNNLTLSGDAFPAAKACRDYGNGSDYDDWFLPSKDELLAMYEKRTEIGGFLNTSTVIYWSSSESINSTTDPQSAAAAVVNFNTGICYDNPRSNAGNVRPIRAF